jgi:glycolate oxidase iron-sulfur subunit
LADIGGSPVNLRHSPEERIAYSYDATGAQAVVTGNPGCIGQIRYGAKRFGVNVEVAHPVTLLARAYR